MAEGKSVSEILVGANGTVRVAPVGTAAPADIASAFSGTWVDLGYTNQDGVTLTDSKTLATVDVWQLFYPARRIITGRSFTAAMVLAQWNEITVPLAFGGGTVTPTTGPPAYYTYTPPAPSVLDERALAIEWTDGSRTYRLIIPKGVVTDNVSSKLTKAGPAELPLTFEATVADGSNPYTLITNDPVFATGTP